jgi:hypothetical protein
MKKLFTLIFIILLAPKATGQWTDLKQLSDAGIDINTFSPQDLLRTGIGNCDIELVKSAIVKGADVNKPFDAGLGGIAIWPLCDAIHWAADAMLPGEESMLASLINNYGAEAYSGRSLSELRHDYIEIIKLLLQKGAKTTVSSDLSSDNIPLLKAAAYRDIEVIKLLLDFKADPNSKSMTAATALHLLGNPDPFSYPYKNGPEIAKLLISKGARATKNDHGQTPLTDVKESLRIVGDPASPWKAYPFYNEMIISFKSLIDIYSKL